jgi:chromosome segregation ATPase
MCLFLLLQQELHELNHKSKKNSEKIKQAEQANRRLTSKIDDLKTKLEESNSINDNLKKELDKKEEILQSDNKEQMELLTTIDGLTKSLDFLNRTVQELCGHPEDVSTYNVQFVTGY